MTPTDTAGSVADRFIAALRTFDADALATLLHPDATRWLNVGSSTRTADEVVAITRLERTLVASWTLDVRQLATTDEGFVVQFVFAGTTRSGLEFHIPLCVVARVVGGRISHYDEYADETSLAPLREELVASGATLAAREDGQQQV
jgi:limonene-1,2-epoxide hydrolase